MRAGVVVLMAVDTPLSYEWIANAVCAVPITILFIRWLVLPICLWEVVVSYINSFFFVA
jgi:hypothetical protein